MTVFFSDKLIILDAGHTMFSYGLTSFHVCAASSTWPAANYKWDFYFFNLCVLLKMYFCRPSTEVKYVAFGAKSCPFNRFLHLTYEVRQVSRVIMGILANSPPLFADLSVWVNDHLW